MNPQESGGKDQQFLSLRCSPSSFIPPAISLLSDHANRTLRSFQVCWKPAPEFHISLPLVEIPQTSVGKANRQDGGKKKRDRLVSAGQPLLCFTREDEENGRGGLKCKKSESGRGEKADAPVFQVLC